MRKASLLIIFLIMVLAGCGNEKNSMGMLSLSERENQLASALAETTFAYDLEHKNLDKPHFNVWVEEYVHGEKQGEDTMVYSSERTESGGGEQIYFSIQATGVDAHEKLVKVIHANEGGQSVSRHLISSDEDLNEMSRTSSNEMGQPDFSDDNEVVIGVIQYAESARELQETTPETLNDGSASLENIPAAYLVKARFGSEQRGE